MPLLEFNLLGLKFKAGVFRVRRVWGVHSKLADGNHYLMWDFDNVTPKEMGDALEFVQCQFSLPPIHLIKTRERHFQAICLYKVNFPKAIEILAATPRVDWNFVRMSIIRGYLTLRIQPEPGSVPLAYGLIDSTVRETVGREEIKSFGRYEKVVRKCDAF